MDDHAHHHGDDNVINVETHHEKSDVNVRALMWAVVVFIVFAVITHVVLYLQFHFLARYFRDEATTPLTSMARPSDMSVPASPRLQPFPNKEPKGEVLPPMTNTPVTDMEQMRAAEEQALSQAGWVDRQKGIVRLPIEVAKQLVLQRGLPVAPAIAAVPAPVAATPPGTASAPRTPSAAPQQGEPNAARLRGGATP